jgi:GT2 family glycosyltransferase/glycosyltransferase involved in cell wall biosynthesis
LLTGSITRFEHELHHRAATVEGLDHPVMARVESETRGLSGLMPEDPALATSVVILLIPGTEEALARCLESVLRQSRPAARVVAACAGDQLDLWRPRLPAEVELIQLGVGAGGWEAVVEALDTSFALLLASSDWLRPDLLYRYALVQRLVGNPESTVIASATVSANSDGEIVGPGRTATSFRPSMPVLLSTEWLDSAVLVPCTSWRNLATAPDPAAAVLGVVLELLARGLNLELISVALRASLDPDASPATLTGGRAFAVGRMLRAHAPSGLVVGPDTRPEPLAPARSSLQVIVPYRDRAEQTLAAVRSVLEQDYPEPISLVAVDNGSRNAHPARELERLGVQVLRVDEPFNYSRLNNMATAGHDSDLLLFLNNDVVLDGGALEELARWAQVPAVGAVGAVLFYPDGLLQHGGIERDPHGPADELRWMLAERGLDRRQLLRASRPRVVDAVTGACLMTRRTVFDEIGGFDEVFYPNAFSDTDLCQRIVATGRVCVVTPRARGTHDESASRRYDRLEDFEGSAWLEERLGARRSGPRPRTRNASDPGRPSRVLTGFDDLGPIGSPMIDIHVSAEEVDRTAAKAWLGGGGLLLLRVLGVDGEGVVKWSVGATNHGARPAQWFVPAGSLERSRGSVELLGLIALSEDVDAVVEAGDDDDRTAAELEFAAARGGIFARRAYATREVGGVSPMAERRVVRLTPPFGRGPGFPASSAEEEYGDWTGCRHRCSFEVGEAPLQVAVRRTWYGLTMTDSQRPTIVVLAPFLANGGAEQTLFEVLRALGDSFHFLIATLVPHRQVLGDRRTQFEEVAEVVSLGEALEGDALVSAVEGLVYLTSAKLVYNANGSGPFYRLAAHLKAHRSGVKVVDHLYDNVHGYISHYRGGEPSAVDTCIAENHSIKTVLVEDRGWHPDRIRVIWPCGRRPRDLPVGHEASAIRHRLRRKLGVATDDVLFLTAARVHPQKRPLDLVELAGRLADEPRAVFFWVGGGELEGELDRAIADLSGGRIRRLPFRDDVPDLILACDVGCLVSDYEGLPVFMLECLQLGRPFLTTDVGDVGRVLEPSGAGLVAGPPGDLALLEGAARRMCDPGFRAEAARRGREASALFAPDRVSAEYAEAFAAAVSGAPLTGTEAAGRGRESDAR